MSMERLLNTSTGVILAGGSATRLPNKPLLPLKNGKPAISSSLELFQRSGISRVVIVIPPNSVIPDVIHRLGCTKGMDVDFAVQSEPTGVPHAIKCALLDRKDINDERIFMSCCDNVYGESELIPLHEDLPYAGVITESRWWRAVHLAKYASRVASTGPWTRYGISDLCVAGWMGLRMHDVMNHAVPGMTTCDFLNAIKARPYKLNFPNNWWDIGTVDTYTYYWRF